MFTLREHAKPIFTGNMFLIFCCIFYLIWWGVSFRPKFHAPMVLSAILFLMTATLGFVGIYWMIKGMILESSSQKELISSNVIIFGAIVLFILLFLVTSYFFHRQLTTELFLILGWGVLVLFEINKLFAFEQLQKDTAILFCFLILTGIAVSLFCYIIYYKLPAQMAYLDGMIPLIVIGAIMAAITSHIKS